MGFAIMLLGVNALIYLFLGAFTVIPVLFSLAFYAAVVNFFRYTERKHTDGDREVVCPADGRVVVIEETDEVQILGRRCLQVSVFMNVFDMHVNWIPCNGVVEHVSHTPGRFLSAHLPKSSTDNERSAVVIRTAGGDQVLVRQVAGAIARRIVTYSEVGQRRPLPASGYRGTRPCRGPCQGEHYRHRDPSPLSPPPHAAQKTYP